MFENTLIISIAVYALILSGCGGSSDSRSDSSSNLPTIQGKVSSYNYIKNANVCLDSNNDMYCSDEPSSYNTTTNDKGEFTLMNLPSDSLKKGTILAVASGEGGSLIAAPGIAAYYNQTNFIVSPLLTLVALGNTNDTDSYYYDTITAFSLFRSIDSAFDLSRFDYVSNSGCDTAKALQYINNAVYSSSEVQALLNDSQNADRTLGTLDLAPNNALPDDFGEKIIADAKAAGIDIEKALVEEMINSLDVDVDFPESLIPKDIAISTNQEINEIMERVESAHTSDINNLAKTIASTIGDIISDIPDPFSQTVGGVISVLTLVWPETPRDYSELSTALYRDAQNMMEKKIVQTKYDSFVTRFTLLKKDLDYYANAPSDFQRRQRYANAMASLRDLLAEVIGAPGQYDKQDAEYFIPMGKILYLGYFFMRREYYRFPEVLVEDWSNLTEEEKNSTKKEALKNWVDDYKDYRNIFLGPNAAGGSEAVYNRFLNRRMSDTFLKMRFDTVFDVISSYNYLILEDAFTNKKIEYRYFDAYASLNIEFFQYSAEALKQRLLSTSKLDVAKELAILSYLPRVFPTDEPYVKENVPKAQGAWSIIFPEELKLIKVGPIARSCSESTSISASHRAAIIGTNYCTHNVGTSDVLPTNIDSDAVSSVNIITSAAPRKPMVGINIDYRSGENKEFYFSQYTSSYPTEMKRFKVQDKSYLTGMPVYFTTNYSNAIISTYFSTVDRGDHGYTFRSSFVDFGDLAERNKHSILDGVDGATYGVEKTNASADFQLIGFGMLAAGVEMFPDNSGVQRGAMMLYPYFRFTPDSW